MTPRMIILLTIFLASNVISMFSGYTYCKGKEGTIIVEQLQKDSKAVDEIKEREVIRYVEVEKIKEVIRNVPDTSGCLDTDLGDIITDQLHQAYSAHP